MDLRGVQVTAGRGAGQGNTTWQTAPDHESPDLSGHCFYMDMNQIMAALSTDLLEMQHCEVLGVVRVAQVFVERASKLTKDWLAISTHTPTELSLTNMASL